MPGYFCLFSAVIIPVLPTLALRFFLTIMFSLLEGRESLVLPRLISYSMSKRTKYNFQPGKGHCLKERMNYACQTDIDLTSSEQRRLLTFDYSISRRVQLTDQSSKH